jgi:hypothetical protein
MALTVLKNTPIHTVIAVTGSGVQTIELINTLKTANQTPVSPVVHIKAIHWSVPTGTATISRNGVTLWEVKDAYQFDFAGFADNRESLSDIVIDIDSGTVILEVMKISGYGDTQHLNQSIGA